MHAIVLESKENPLVYKEVPEPVLQPGEAQVGIKAAALNRRDYWITIGKYAGIKYPTILGSDGAGIVTRVADEGDDHWIGKEVVINPSNNWGDSPDFQGKDFNILGLPANGTLAEYVKVPTANLHVKPAHLSFEQAAALPLAGLTAYRALFVKAKLKPGGKVLIIGAGSGTGTFALQFAAAAGCKVFVTSGTGEKIERARKLGAAAGVSYKAQDWAEQLQELAGGFDVVIDSALGEGFAKIPDLCNPGARIVIFGGTAGDIPAFSGRKLFWKQLQLIGSTMGTPADFAAMLEFVNQHQIVPVVDEVFALVDAKKAFDKLGDSSQFGKLVLRPDAMLKLRVESIRQETPDAATFYLSDANGGRVTYQAGQFLTLVFDHHSEEARRSYSISSSPDEEFLAITIKRVPNGQLSRFLLSHTKPGDIWQAIEPAGRFLVAGFDQPRDLFFFAAGSGITPVFSQLKYILARPGKSRLALIYSNRNFSHTIYKVELDALQQQHPGRLKIIYLNSDEGALLNNNTAEQLIHNESQFVLNNRLFYLCGPFDYMRMLRLTLLYLGVDEQNIHKENFVLETVPVSGSRQNFAPHKVRINFKGEDYDIVTGENQSILQAALQNNIPLPYSCRAGICASCEAKCIAGKVFITQNEVLTDKDLSDDWVLTCTGYALDDKVVIRVD